jgi:hypothetical protein
MGLFDFSHEAQQLPYDNFFLRPVLTVAAELEVNCRRQRVAVNRDSSQKILCLFTAGLAKAEEMISAPCKASACRFFPIAAKLGVLVIAPSVAFM